MGLEVDDEWWLDCVLPPMDVDPDALPPDVDDDPGADVERVWSECELPPVPPWDERETPPVPWPGASMLIIGSEVLIQPGVRATGDDTAPVPLEHSWLAGLTSVELVDAARELQALQAWVEGCSRQVLARVADLDPTVDLWSRAEVGAALRITSLGAGSKMAAAQRLCHDLPLTLESMLAGRITSGHVTAVLDTAALIPTDLAGHLEDAVLARAGTQTVPQLRRSLRRVAITLNPDIAEQARQAARERRGVGVYPGEDGMSAVVATLSAEDAAAIHALLNAAADMRLIADRADRKGDPDGMPPLRTKDQVRADLLVEVILGGLDPDFLPTQQGRRPVINVHVSLDTLTGVNDEHAWLDGYGPITAGAARELAADQTGTWRRLITDPATRRLLDYDVTKYVPPRPVADHVMNTRPTCSFPGCARPAQETDLDHAKRHSRGGLTVAVNLHPLCRWHHRLKEEGGWNPTLGRDGTVDWISPQRRRYRTQANNRLGPEPDNPDDSSSGSSSHRRIDHAGGHLDDRPTDRRAVDPGRWPPDGQRNDHSGDHPGGQPPDRPDDPAPF